MIKKYSLLLTNDDGFFALGINHLYEKLKDEFFVTIVAPENEQSGIGHAFTYKKPIAVTKHFQEGENVGYSVSGTPSDCVKIALGNILSKKPDLIVSGINNGSNTGIAGYYSGTVAAAREGAFWHVPSIALSLYENSSSLFKDYAQISQSILQTLLDERAKATDNNVSKRVFLNINFPSCHPKTCAGIRVTKQSLSYYLDTYSPVKRDDNTVEYWLKSEIREMEQSNDYDTYAIRNNFITVTPLNIDATDVNSFTLLSCFKNIL